MPAKAKNPGASRTWSARFVRQILAWIVPCAVVWLLATPVYNRLLAGWTELFVRFTERPAVSHVEMQDAHHAAVRRSDYVGDKNLYRIRVTDLHFHLILTGALFLAVPGLPLRRRLENLSYALLATILFDLLLFFFFVKFVYATQLGSWSTQHYGAFARNFWGLGKHMLDLAFKFALPLILWAAFYYREFVVHLAPERLGRRKS
jgi:hypothetical protein